MAGATLANQTHGALADFRGELYGFLHGSIFSRVGASSKSGAVHYDKENNPLGVEELHFEKEHISPPKILEYKFNLDSLIQEFECEYKNEKDIHLAITWEMGNEWKKNYDATSFLDLDNLHQRDYHGITHMLDSGTTKFHVVALKELIDFLNDVDGVQEYHKQQYGDDLF